MPASFPRIALIHATALAVAPIQAAFERQWPQARRMNLLDDSLSVDRAVDGELTPAMTQRFVDLAHYARGTGCSGILFTCSAFGVAIEAAGLATGLPTLKPNQAMFEQALKVPRLPAGRPRVPGAPPPPLQVGLIATFEPSLPAMAEELQSLARERGVAIVLRTAFVPRAMKDLAAGRVEDHHQLVADAAQAQLATCDVVMLAQFSMADAQPQVQAGLACPVLTSPDCAVQALRQAVPADRDVRPLAP